MIIRRKGGGENVNDTIGDWRRRIDKLDGQIIKLLDSRTQCAVEIGKVKAATGAPVYDPKREAEVVERLTALARVIPKKSLEAVYREIFSAARAVEKPLSVAFLGPLGTFSHEAAIALFGTSNEFKPLGGFSPIVKAVEGEECDFGVLPIESSVEGPVNANLDLLKDSALTIFGEKTIAAHQNLLSKAKSINAIKRLHSHMQPLGQCRGYIQRMLPGVEIYETDSTAAGAAKAARDKNAAAIGSLAAARIYNLNVLDKNIEDGAAGKTRFVVISRSAPKRTGKDKTSIAVSIKNRPGELFRLLALFNKAKINLTQIASRPLKAGAWGYLFFIDLDGHREDAAVEKTLKQVAGMSDFLKILGSYPKGNG